MQTIAIKRYKNHQILIAKEVKYYIQKIKLENSENVSSEEVSSDNDGIESLNESLDSVELNDNFAKALEKQKTLKRKSLFPLNVPSVASNKSVEN